MSLSRRRLLQLSGGLALCATTYGRAETVTDDWSGDVAILRQAWETMHPGVYRYSTPEEITARLNSLARAWTAPGSFRDRFLALTRVTASLKCGHTYPSPYNSSDATVARIYPDRSLVPFLFRWIDGRMVVIRDDSRAGLFPRGTVITAIDGVMTRDLLVRLTPLARADGSNLAKRISLMEARGEDRYETFDIHLPLVLPLKDQAVFTLAGGHVVRAPLLTLADRRAGFSASVEVAKDSNPWTLSKGADGVHRLTMPGWALYDSNFDWRAWLGGVMDDLTGDGARGLIVDLRGNEGGIDCGNVVISRLIDRDLALSRDQRWTRYRTAPEGLRPYLKTWDRRFLDWGEAAVASQERPGFYRLTHYDDDSGGNVIRPEGRRFEGRVAVLCDASNSSATFGFGQTCKDNGLATLVGQTTGGNRRGINGGAFFFLQLPASRLEVDLPLIASFPATPQPDAAIAPDIAVATTARDIATGRDPQMLAATQYLIGS
ncbi:S41 family peptidase [Caulobacter endophyticus]|uniref:S41 family peptidase n=1 Tax=Caulobacter endophyticus TaxID=2172652 RepID=UPI00240FF654|nr:S41 family peptidase [Caulobacter endophyticus]MDG2528152.1 S41 family peptidase [Caulobacter endophyticus]